MFLVFFIAVFSLLIELRSSADQWPPPNNLSLSWNPDMWLIAQWKRPSNLSVDCKVKYTINILHENCSPKTQRTADICTKNLRHKELVPNLNGVCVLLKTCMADSVTCGTKNCSEEIFKGLPPPPALVKNISCYLYANKKMNCTWLTVSHTSDLQFFYKIRNEGQTNSFKPCNLYITSESTKTGCHLFDEMLKEEDVFIVINGTEKGLAVKNSFIINTINSVKPPQPKLTVKQNGSDLILKSTTPGFLNNDCWTYMYNYRSCNKNVTVEGKSTKLLQYDLACRYIINVQIILLRSCGSGESEISEPVSYGKDGDPDLAFKVVMIVTPAIVSCCLIVALVLFTRHRHIILPKIPEPSLIFKDMFNGNDDRLSKRSGTGKLYVPVKEVVADVNLEPKSTLINTPKLM